MGLRRAVWMLRQEQRHWSAWTLLRGLSPPYLQFGFPKGLTRIADWDVSMQWWNFWTHIWRFSNKCLIVMVLNRNGMIATTFRFTLKLVEGKLRSNPGCRRIFVAVCTTGPIDSSKVGAWQVSSESLWSYIAQCFRHRSQSPLCCNGYVCLFWLFSAEEHGGIVRRFFDGFRAEEPLFLGQRSENLHSVRTVSFKRPEEDT